MPQSDTRGPRRVNWSQYTAWRGPADGAWMTADEVVRMHLAAQHALRARLRRWDFPLPRPRAVGSSSARLGRLLLAAGADLGLLYLMCSTALLWLGSVLANAATQGTPLTWSEVLLCAQTLLVGGGYLGWRIARLASQTAVPSAPARATRGAARSRPRGRRSGRARLSF